MGGLSRQELDFGVDGGGLARDGFEHGVGAEGVEVGAGIGEGEAGSDGGEGDGRVEGESTQLAWTTKTDE